MIYEMMAQKVEAGAHAKLEQYQQTQDEAFKEGAQAEEQIARDIRCGKEEALLAAIGVLGRGDDR